MRDADGELVLDSVAPGPEAPLDGVGRAEVAAAPVDLDHDETVTLGDDRVYRALAQLGARGSDGLTAALAEAFWGRHETGCFGREPVLPNKRQHPLAHRTGVNVAIEAAKYLEEHEEDFRGWWDGTTAALFADERAHLPPMPVAHRCARLGARGTSTRTR